MKISACILTYNCVEKVERLLKSLDFVDEIVVTDSGSTDGTLELVKKYTKKVFTRKLTNFGEQRNFCASKSSNNWILALDSDEEITSQLKKEILEKLKSDQFDGYFFPRLTYFAGKPIRHSGWYPNKTIKLYNRTKMSFADSPVHEKIIPSGKIGDFKNPILHYSYTGIRDYLSRLKKYTAMQPDNPNVPKNHLNLLLMFLKPFYRFFRMYIWELGFLDGWRGLFLAKMSAIYDFRVHFLAEKRVLTKAGPLFYVVIALLLTVFQGYLIANLGILGLGFTLFIIFFLLMFCNLKTAILVLFLSVLMGQIGRINFTSGGGLIISDLIAPFFLVSWLIYKMAKDPKFLKTPINLSLILIMIALIITFILAMPNYYSLGALFYLIRLLMYLSLFWPFYDFLKNEKTSGFSVKMFEYLMYAMVIIGLIQLKVFPNMLSLMAEGWDPHQNRMVATFLDPNFLAGFLNIGFAYFLAKFYSSNKPFPERILPVIILGLGAALTVSRSGWMMLAIIIGIFAVLKDRRIFIIIVLVLFLTIEFVPRFSQRISEGFSWRGSAALRLDSWKQGYELISKNFYFGVGYNNLQQAKLQDRLINRYVLESHSASGVDSSLMVIWSTAGIFGLLIFLYFFLKNIYLGFKAFFREKKPMVANLGLAVAAIFIGLFVHSVFLNSLLYPHIIIAYMFILALFYVLLGKSNEKTN